MKIKAKKGLALVLSLLMVISLLSVVIFNVAADPVVEQWNELSFEKSENAVVNNGETDDSISGDQGEWAYTILETALPKFKMKPALNADGDEAYVSVTNGTIIESDAVKLDANKGLNLKFVRNGSALKIYVYTVSQTWTECASVDGYDFNTAHTFSWSRLGTYTNWYITVDGTEYKSAIISDYIYCLGAESAFTFFGVDSGFGFENVQINGGVSDSFTELTSKGNVNVSGNVTDGYDISTNVSWSYATYNKAFDFDTTLVSFKLPKASQLTTQRNQFVGFTISTNFGGRLLGTGAYKNDANPSGDSITLGVIYGWGTNNAAITFQGKDGALTNIPLSKFDANTDHLMGIVYSGGAYKLYFDGSVYANSVIDKYVSKMVGNKVFYNFKPYNVSGVSVPLEDVKFVDMTQGEGFWPHYDRITSGQSADGSYWLDSGSTKYDANMTVAVKGAINPANQGFSMQFMYPDNSNYWTTFILNNSPTTDNGCYAQSYDSKSDTIRFIFKRLPDTDTCRVSLYHYGINEVGYGNIENFDWSVPHTVNFVRNLEGIWQIYIDGKIPDYMTDIHSSGAPCYQVVENTITPILNKLEQSGAYLHIGASNLGGRIEGIKKLNFLTSNSTIKESKTDAGFTLTDTANDGRATFLTKINPMSQYISFKQDEFGAYSQICFSNNFVPYTAFDQGKAAEVANKIVNIHLEKQDTKLVVKCCYYGAGDTLTVETLGEINGYDFTVAHTLGFVKDASDNWVVAVDNVVYDNFVYSGALRDYLNTTVENLTTGNVYVQFGTNGGKLGFSEIKNANIPNVPHERTKFYYTVNEYTFGGNSGIGYSISNENNNSFVGFKDAIDFNSKSIYAKFNIAINKTAFLGFSNTYQNIAGYPDASQEANYNAIGFLFKKISPDVATVSAYYNGTENVIGDIEFNWNTAHWYGFAKEDGKWRLMIDGLYHFDLSETAPEVFTALNTKITNFANAGNAYAVFGSKDAPVNIESVKVMNNTDIVIPVVKPFRCDTGIEYSGQEVGGYNLTGQVADVVAGFKSVIDINKTSIRLQATIPDGAMAHLGFANSYAKVNYQPTTDDEDKYSAISLYLKKSADNELTICCYFNGAEQTLGKVSEFNWDLAHTYGFVKTDNEWALAVDGVAIADKGDDYVAIMEHISPLLNILATSKKAYAQLGFIGGNANFSRIITIANEDISAPEECPFTLDSSMIYDGNVKTGYTVQGTTANKFAVYNKPFDVDGQSIFTVFNMPQNKWGVFAISTTQTAFTTGLNNVENEQNYNAVFLMFRRQLRNGQDVLTVSVNYIDETGTFKEKYIGYSQDINWNAGHAIGLSYNGGKWSVLIDGRQPDIMMQTANEAIEHVTPLLNNLKDSENVYLQISMYDTYPNFSRFKVVANSEVDELVRKEQEENEEEDTDVGDWDDSWNLDKGDNDDDDDWEFTFGEEDEDGFFDFDFGEEDEDFIFENLDNEDNEDEEPSKGKSYKKVTYITKEIPGLTTTQIVLIVVGSVLAAGAVAATVIIILVKRKKKKLIP